MKYSTERKQAVLAKLCPPHNRTIREVAAEEGISEATLYNWRKQARERGELYPDAGSDAEGWTARDKFAAVLETAAMNESEQSEYCRKRGLYPDQLATGAWIKASETLLIQGPPGVGKTHLAVGLGVKAIEQGFSAQFYRFDELLVALKADAELAPARLQRKKYLNTALLIIDELGFEPMDRAEASLFFRLVTYRYGRGSILITTNKSVRDWSELLAGDEPLTAAILDRLLHKAHVINIKGRSYRLRDLEQTLGARAN